MGNSNSASAGARRVHASQNGFHSSPSPSLPNNNITQPNKSLKTKRKSLELPDLAHLSITSPYPSSALSPGRVSGRSANPPKSASIPIPNTSPEVAQSRQRPQREESEISVAEQPMNRSGNPYFRGTQQQQRHEDHAPNYGSPGATPATRVPAPPPTRNPSLAPASMTPMQELSSPGYEQVTVRSSIPQPPRKEAAESKPILVKISWNGGGKSVYLARAGDEDWKGRRVMTLLSPESPTFTITIPLLPGTHHLRFLVDNQWRVADDLPAAVDDQGSLANYVAVGLDGIVTGGVVETNTLALVAPALPSPPAPGNAPRKLPPGQSFWSASSTMDGDESAGPSHHYPQSPRQTSSSGRGTVWTDEIPLELSEAAVEEDTYLQATSTSNVRGHTHVVNGFVPLPQIPPAPALPKHLEKLILNHKHAPTTTTLPVTSASVGLRPSTPSRVKGKPRDREKTDESVSSSSGSPTTPIRPTSPQVPMSTSFSNSTRIAPPSALDDTVIADDTSVLPVPSHVVLHHLTTSAIRNGVLAVGETVRYKKKYVTTIYYKPTEV